MTAPLVWLVVGLVLVAAELASGEFVLLMLGGGALVAAGASLVLGTVGSALVFALAAISIGIGCPSSSSPGRYRSAHRSYTTS